MYGGRANAGPVTGGPAFKVHDNGEVEITNPRGLPIPVGTLRKPYVLKIAASNAQAGYFPGTRTYRAELEVAHPKPILREIKYASGKIESQEFHDDIWVLA